MADYIDKTVVCQKLGIFGGIPLLHRHVVFCNIYAFIPNVLKILRNKLTKSKSIRGEGASRGTFLTLP